MKIIAGRSNPELAQKIAQQLGAPLVPITIKRFGDDEIFVTINESVQGDDVFVIQSTSSPANDHLMELLIIVDALKRGSARRITAVIPYYGYGRQDRQSSPVSPITAQLVANLVTAAGADRAILMDLHSPHLQGFFEIPVDHLTASSLFIQDMQATYGADPIVIVSPDKGGAERVRYIAKSLGQTVAVIDKCRADDGAIHTHSIMGDVRGEKCVIVDDIIASGETLYQAAVTLMGAGACSVDAYITHAVLSPGATYVLDKMPIGRLTVTDTICIPKNLSIVRILSTGGILADAIRRISQDIALRKNGMNWCPRGDSNSHILTNNRF